MRKIAQFLILPVVLTIVAGCGNKPATGEGAAPKQGGTVATMAKAGQLATDPIAQMSLEFQGNPPQDQIRVELDKALAMYGLEPNNDNRSNAGRTLVALRKEQGHAEMAILEKMLHSPVEGKFDEAASKISADMNR
jgi:hypothetical protein